MKFFFAAVLALSALSASFAPKLTMDGPRPHLPKNALPLPIVAQATSYSCGAAALMSVLLYWNVFDGTESDLYEPLSTTPKDGTHPFKIIEVAKSMGLEATYKENTTIQELKEALARKETVILDIQAWHGDKKTPSTPDWKELWDDGHYVVLVALDDQYAYMADPVVATGYVFVPIAELKDRWHDYEDRDGKVWRNYGLALFISGKTPNTRYPAAPIRLN